LTIPRQRTRAQTHQGERDELTLNAAFERAEYMEDYVAESIAREMLASNPAVKEAFERKLKDRSFANDPAARLEFFYRCHPSWDERFNLYPVLRTASYPTQAGRPATTAKRAPVLSPTG
jgi:hypothetical protein